MKTKRTLNGMWQRLGSALVVLCMLASLFPVSVFAAQANPPRNVALEALGEGKIQATWNYPESVTTIALYEFKAELFRNGVSVATKDISNYPFTTFTDQPSDNVSEYGVKIQARQAVNGVGDPDNLATYYPTDWTDWSTAAEYGNLSDTPTEQLIDKIELVNAKCDIVMGRAPQFGVEVTESDRDKYEVTYEEWTSEDGKSITNDPDKNAAIPEDKKLTVFEEVVNYSYNVWVQAKDGYIIADTVWRNTYINGKQRIPTITVPDLGEFPKEPFKGALLVGIWKDQCEFDFLKVYDIQVTRENMHDVLGDEDGDAATVRYNPDTHTLTFDNAHFDTYADGVNANVPGLIVELIGDNSIAAADNGMPFCAIGNGGDLTITGNGSLTVNGLPFGIYCHDRFSSSAFITIEDGATLILNCSETPDYDTVRALASKPDLSGYPEVRITAGDSAETAVEITDPDNTDYYTNKYVKISPKNAPEPEPCINIQAAAKNSDSVSITAAWDALDAVPSVYAAVYDTNGRILAVKAAQNANNTGTQQFTLPVNGATTEQPLIIKLFMWGGTSKAEPLVSSAEKIL